MFQIKRFLSRALFIATLACSIALFAFTVNAAGQQKLEYAAGSDIKTVLFKDANAALEAAKNTQADLLAPKSFGEAMKHYQEAETDLKGGKSVEGIQKKLSESMAYFQKAIDATTQAKLTFPILTLMKARKDAQINDSARFPSKLWAKADAKFREAAAKLEGGDVNGAKKRADEAEALYRQAELEVELDNRGKKQSVLVQQAAMKAITHEVFAHLERSFSHEEARVLREGNDIIIRLIGLNFPSAEATIEQQSFGLLTKVRDAINAFPESAISVLGHTDSYGSDEKNLQLSKERAEAVKQNLLANSKLNAFRVEAIGYGESKPIASNETVAGRASNRRVEVVIHPWTMIGTD